MLYTTNIPDGSISRLDLAAGVNEGVTKIARLTEGVTMTPDSRFVWVGSNGDSIVVVYDVARRQAVDTLRGFGIPYRLAATSDNRLVVVTDPARAEVRVFDAATRRQRLLVAIPADSVLPTAEVQGSPAPEGVTTSGDGRYAFVTLQGRNRMIAIDLRDGRIVRSVPTGTWSDGIAWARP